MILGVPYDAEVEYLESTGTQWIDTGFKFEVGCGVNLDVQMTGNVTGTTQVLAAAAANDGCWFGAINISNVLRYGVGATAGRYFDALPGINRAYLRGVWGTMTRLTADGYSAIEVVRSTTPTNNIGLFANYGGTYSALCKIYSTKVLDINGNVVRDLVPVRFTNEQGVSEGAMYDRVTHKLFRNAGTGSFIVGPDVATPIMSLRFMCNAGVMTTKDYIQDGLVAMWDGIENIGWGNSDKQSTNWIDLVGGIKVPVNASLAHFTGNSLYFPERSVGLPGDRAAPEYRTITFVVERTTWQSRVVFQSGNKRRQVLSNVAAAYAHWYFDGGRNPLGSVYRIFNKSYGDPSGRIDSITAVFGDDSDIYAPTAVWHNSGQVSSTATSYNSNWATGSTCRIGGVAKNAGAGISGNIFNIRLYNRALTAAEIATNYIVDKARFNLP